MRQTAHQIGKLEIICGPMFSGKSEELIRRIRRAKIAQQQVVVFKPKLDTRRGIHTVTSHNGSYLDAIPVDKLDEIATFIMQDPTIQVIGIDEIQFFPQEIIDHILKLVSNGKRVIAAGLDLDFRGIPFGPLPTLLAIADQITKLQSICMICGKDAPFTQRLIDNKPASFDDKVILIGAQESYQARCRGCYRIDRMPTFAQHTAY
jgi:thymidine kinase